MPRGEARCGLGNCMSWPDTVADGHWRRSSGTSRRAGRLSGLGGRSGELVHRPLIAACRRIASRVGAEAQGVGKKAGASGVRLVSTASAPRRCRSPSRHRAALSRQCDVEVRPPAAERIGAGLGRRREHHCQGARWGRAVCPWIRRQGALPCPHGGLVGPDDPKRQPRDVRQRSVTIPTHPPDHRVVGVGRRRASWSDQRSQHRMLPNGLDGLVLVRVRHRGRGGPISCRSRNAAGRRGSRDHSLAWSARWRRSLANLGVRSDHRGRRRLWRRSVAHGVVTVAAVAAFLYAEVRLRCDRRGSRRRCAASRPDARATVS